MRILAASDIHGAPVVYDWLMNLCHSPLDALVLAGDLLEGDFAPGQREKAKKLVTLLRSSPIPIFYLMGNDDNVSLDYEDHLIQPIHGRRVEMRGYNFVGYQFTPPFVGDAFVKPDEEIEEDLKLLEPMLDERTILVTHAPAFGILDEDYGENLGSRAIAGLLRRKPVSAHIHGHIHGRFGREGNTFNVASAKVSRAMVIDFPALTHTVVDYFTSAV
jgi:Icc-related predicted phosphoesterase